MSDVEEVSETIPYNGLSRPCFIGVISFHQTPGSYDRKADNDAEFYGYTESEYLFLNEDGTEAQWAEDELASSSPVDRQYVMEEINILIESYFQGWEQALTDADQ